MLNRAALAAAIVLMTAAAHAQTVPGQRFMGTIKVATPAHVVLATADKGDMDLPITAQTKVTYRVTASAADIKPGTYLGTSNLNTANGGQATEVHLADNGPNVHFPMNNAGLMMTNGHVKSVTATAKGEEMDVDYGAAAPRHVVVPADATVTRSVAGDLAMLKPGTPVTVYAAAAADGKLQVLSISIKPTAAK